MYNKEEVMKEWQEKFPRMQVKGSPENEMRDVMQVFIDKQNEEIEQFLSTALDAAYKAGREDIKQKIEECIETCSDDISFLDSDDNRECIRIFKINLKALK